MWRETWSRAACHEAQRTPARRLNDQSFMDGSPEGRAIFQGKVFKLLFRGLSGNPKKVVPWCHPCRQKAWTEE